MHEKEHRDHIVIFENKAGDIKVEVKLNEGTVWLTQSRIAEIFEKERSVITKHINNILKEKELEESVCAKFAHTGADRKTYRTKYYNLDMIISVGYRVNSKKGIEFRRWANAVLKDYLIKGYSFNQQRLTAETIEELRQTIELLSNTLIHQNLIDSEGAEILSVIKNYARTWDLLVKYDENKLEIPAGSSDGIETLSYDTAISAIQSIKKDLDSKGIAVKLFGNEKDNSLKSILGNIYQTFDGKDLYRSIEEKAAHLIYLIIKNHPFSDGNKRIGCFLFMLFMQKNKKFFLNIPTPEALTAIGLLIAESSPEQKDLIIRLVINLIKGKAISKA